MKSDFTHDNPKHMRAFDRHKKTCKKCTFDDATGKGLCPKGLTHFRLWWHQWDAMWAPRD
jgi:hypothetical protein